MEKLVNVDVKHEVKEALRLYFLPLTALARLVWVILVDVMLKGARRITIRGED